MHEGDGEGEFVRYRYHTFFPIAVEPSRSNTFRTPTFWLPNALQLYTPIRTRERISNMLPSKDGINFAF
jgi:hypothetical protein